MRPTLSIKLGQSDTRYAVPSSLTGGGLPMRGRNPEVEPLSLAQPSR